MTADRSAWPTRKIRLEDEDGACSWDGFTPGELVEMVWVLTLQAWELKTGTPHAEPMRRDIVRVVRDGLRDDEADRLSRR